MNRWIVVGMVCAASAAHGQLLKNDGFESGNLDGWIADGASWAMDTNGVARSGAEAVVNTGNEETSDGYQVLHQEVAVAAGDICTGGFWVRAPSGSNAIAYLEFQFLNAKGEIVEQYQSDHLTEGPGYGFRGISTVSAPEGTVLASIRAVVYRKVKPGLAGDLFVFDAVSFGRSPPLAPAGVRGKKKKSG
jgi:hypothetical protein